LNRSQQSGKDHPFYFHAFFPFKGCKRSNSTIEDGETQLSLEGQGGLMEVAFELNLEAAQVSPKA
jgi:hypothetical protein